MGRDARGRDRFATFEPERSYWTAPSVLLTEKKPWDSHEGARFNAGIVLITLARLAAVTDEARRRLTGADRRSGPVDEEPLVPDHTALL